MARSQISEVVAALEQGDPAVFPTDTVYGLGVAVGFSEGPGVLFDVKKRPAGKPVAWLVGSVEDLEAYGRDLPESAVEAARRFWPGPLTLVVKASDLVPAPFRSEEGTVGLRMPDDDTALEVIRAVGCPVATTSANISGEPAPRSFSEVDPRILEAAVSCTGDGSQGSGLASTVLDCTGERLRVIREGAISLEDVEGCRERGLEERRRAASKVVRRTLFLDSADGKRRVHVRVWESEGPCRGVVQILHGMAEHSGRYDAFAECLASSGLSVVSHDHAGHGLTAVEDDLGHIPLDQGSGAMVDDVDLVRSFAAREFGGVPIVLFGHSMGSYLARVYARTRAAGLAGLVLCGTGQVPVFLSRLGCCLAKAVCAAKGEKARSGLLHSLADGAFSRKVENPRTPFDWICTDDGVVDEYVADGLSGFPFKASGYVALMDLTGRACEHAAFSSVPRSLPILVVSGALDPVGDFGAGPRAVAQAYRAAGVEQVSCTVYPGMRHEILNEPGRDEVFSDVRYWIEDVCLPRKEAR